MENLNGHEAGNGGYSQGDTYGNSPFLDPTRAQRRVAHSNGWKSRHGKSRSHVAWMAGGDGNVSF